MSRVLSGWVDRQALAKELSISDRTLARWAAERIGPPFVKVGRKAWYRREAVAKWLKEQEAKGGPQWWSNR